MEKEKQASLSTNYRFKKLNRYKQINTFLQFRNQYENVLQENQIHQLKNVYHHGICGKNQKGNLVVVDRVGCLKMNQINKIIDQQTFVAYTSQRLLHISQKILGQKQQVIWVIDLQGKIMQLASKKVLSVVSKIIINLQKYFPQILHKMYLVNTPMLFDTIWNKICPDVSSKTQQKIVMLSEQLQTLYDDVPNSLLPQFLGGQIEQSFFLKDCNEEQNSNKQNNRNKQNFQQEEQEEQEQQQFDFASLKQALSGMKMGNSNLQSVSQTPLNTQADDN